MSTAKTARLKTWSTVGTVLCTLMLAFGGLIAFVTMNWHRSDGMSGWMFPAFVSALVFRILRMNLFRWIMILLCDLVIIVLVYKEVIFPHGFSLNPHAFDGSFWVTVVGTCVVIADWTLRLVLWNEKRKLIGKEAPRS